MGFKLSEKATVNGESMPIEDAIFKNNDYGAIVGAGLDIGRHFFADVRYSLGLQKVLAGIDLTDLKVMNGVFSATVGIAF